MSIASYADMSIEQRTQKRIDLLVSLGRQRDKILNSQVFNIEAVRGLVLAYRVAGFASCAEDLQRRVEHYEERLKNETAIRE